MHMPRNLQLFAQVLGLRPTTLIFVVCVFGHTANKFDVKLARHIAKKRHNATHVSNTDESCPPSMHSATRTSFLSAVGRHPANTTRGARWCR